MFKTELLQYENKFGYRQNSKQAASFTEYQNPSACLKYRVAPIVRLIDFRGLLAMLRVRDGKPEMPEFRRVGRLDSS